MSIRVAMTATAMAACIGIPCAYYLARRRGAVSTLIEAVLIAPLVLPPTVIGYLLLMVAGRRTPLGGLLQALGVPLIFTPFGAVVAALVVALPLVILPSKAAMQSVSPELRALAATDGLGRIRMFQHVVLPVASRGIQAGILLCFARALGEFGATLMVAGNIPGRTTTLPTAIYSAMASGHDDKAAGPVIVLIALAILVVCLHRLLLRPAR